MKTAFGRTRLLANATAPGAGEPVAVQASNRVYQVTLAGAGSAQVAVEVSIDGLAFHNLATVAVSSDGTAVASEGFANTAAWPYVRARVLALTGSVSVDVLMGV